MKNGIGQYVLGLDLSTQSLSSVALDLDTANTVFELSLNYRKDNRLLCYGINSEYILPPKNEGEASQPVAMYFTAIDAIFNDMSARGFPLDQVAVINISAQQHGHVYLNTKSPNRFNRLKVKESSQSCLVDLLCDSLAYHVAPIWMTSNTIKQADSIREYSGGKQRIIEITGSDTALRFTGVVMRKVAQQYPRVYDDTWRIMLLSNLISAILCGNADTPVDFANACGMSLMDYHDKQWSNLMVEAVAEGIPGGVENFKAKLPAIVTPYTIVGRIAAYFVGKYGINPDCRIVVGSGDNPQSKVLVKQDLLSLGSSFVIMMATDGNTFDFDGAANAMYDGLGRPFIFGCRTNGTLVWDKFRMEHGFPKDDFNIMEKQLQATSLGKYMTFWQPRTESFPPSGVVALTNSDYPKAEPQENYTGLVEASLSSVFMHSNKFLKKNRGPLYVTGGVTSSGEIMRRVAAIWNRPVSVMADSGAAIGAALAGIYALSVIVKCEIDLDMLCSRLLNIKKQIIPNADDVAAFHSQGGYLDRFAIQEKRILASAEK